jgi:hypothetical protein
MAAASTDTEGGGHPEHDVVEAVTAWVDVDVISRLNLLEVAARTQHHGAHGASCCLADCCAPLAAARTSVLRVCRAIDNSGPRLHPQRVQHTPA